MYIPGWPTPIPGGNGAPQVYPASQPGQNSLMQPPASEVASNRQYVLSWGDAIARAQAALKSAVNVSESNNATYPASGPAPSQQGESFPGSGMPTGDGFSAAQMQEINDAPTIGTSGQYVTPTCSPVETLKPCPPKVSAPGWDNAAVGYPAPKPCPKTFAGWVQANPWLFIGLVVAGGLALDSMLDDGKQ